MPTCVIDVRCLQDPPFRERGIGRHARALLSHARAMLPGTRMVALTDASLPALSDSLQAMVDGIRVSAYTGAMMDAHSFVQLSPMTHDPLFCARFLHHPSIPAATVVYDFIPLDEPARYLSSQDLKLDYHVALRWLARHDMFMPISADAASRLQGLLNIPDHHMVVTGAPLAKEFATLQQGQPAHILVVGGSDPRKNPECAIRAHARSPSLQAAAVPLIVTGAYHPQWIAEQRHIVAGLGGNPALVLAPGHVDEANLLALYAGAWFVVAPSQAEGFSLPVIEAMAAQAPVLASDIPAHRELLAAGLFPVGDDAALASLMEKAMLPAWRSEALTRQAGIWPRFREEEVARRFWSGVARLAPETRPDVVKRRPRLALLTPLPPDRSGVADYSAAMCEELGKRVDLHVFTPTSNPTNPAGVTSVKPLTALPLVSTEFDRVVAVLGNSVFHLEILRLLLRYGGAAIMHDSRMLDLYAGHMTLEKTVAMAEAELGRTLYPNEIWRWLAGEESPEALILAEVVAASEPLMMHSRAAISAVEKRYDAKPIHLPFSLYRTISDHDLSPQRRAEARSRLGVAEGDVVLASFGYVHPTKAPIDCIWALDLLRSWGIKARLHFIGAPLMQVEPLEALIDQLGLSAHVRLRPDFVDEQAYRDNLLGADIGIQLRTGGSGSVSGALADCIAYGLPTVASHSLTTALDAPDFVAAVPDSPSPVLVAEAVAALLGQPPTTAARRQYVETHGFDSYTSSLCAALGLA